MQRLVYETIQLQLLRRQRTHSQPVYMALQSAASNEHFREGAVRQHVLGP